MNAESSESDDEVQPSALLQSDALLQTIEKEINRLSSLLAKVMQDKDKDEESLCLLDPELWKHLPEDLLLFSVGKLPLQKLASLRCLSKLWKAELVKKAALTARTSTVPAHRETSASCVLYLEPWLLSSSTSFSECCSIQIKKTDGQWYQAFHKFPSRRIRNGWFEKEAKMEIVAAEGGLLIFDIVSREPGFHKDIVKGLVVVNPLTGIWKFVDIPFVVFRRAVLSVGAVVSPVGSYKILMVGLNKRHPSFSMLYDSSTATWKTTATVPSTVTAMGVGKLLCGRPVSSEGKLYWMCRLSSNCENPSDDCRNTLTVYDMEIDRWNLIDLGSGCSIAHLNTWIEAHSKIVSYEGSVLLSHFHRTGVSLQDVTIGDCNLWRHDSGLDVNIKFMGNFLFSQIWSFLNHSQARCTYDSFGEENLVYNVLCTHENVGSADVIFNLRILIYNTEDTSQHELILVRTDRAFRPSCLWCLFPSLVATP